MTALDLQGKMCLYRGRSPKKSALSATLGYGWKIAITPVNATAANKGCLRNRMLNPGPYEIMCSQNTPRKNSRNESNISMKKYHQRPTLGVRSGRRSNVP